MDSVVNLSCGCGAIDCCCCMTGKRSRYTPGNIQEAFNRLTSVYNLKKNQIPHAKMCLEERQFSHPSPALRYAVIPRRKLPSTPEPISFVLPIQYNANSISWKKFPIEKYCEWPFTSLSEYMRSYHPYSTDEMRTHRGKGPPKEDHFPFQDIEPMAQFTTYSKAYVDPRCVDQEKN